VLGMRYGEVKSRMDSLQREYDSWREDAMRNTSYAAIFPGFMRYIPLLDEVELKLYIYLAMYARFGQIAYIPETFADVIGVTVPEVIRATIGLQRNLLIGMIVDDTIVLSLYSVD
jgi:hypothetical protein